MISADDLNRAVGMVQSVPRVRFEAAMSLDAANWIVRKHVGGAVHEPGMIGAFIAVRDNYQNINVIYDAGALFGYFSLVGAMLFPGAKIHALEMHCTAYKDLKINVAGRVKCTRTVLSDRVAVAERIWVSGFNIYEQPDGGWENLKNIPGAMKERGANNRGRFFDKVDFTTLDAYCADNPAPDLLKIDVESYQARAILGGLKMIEQKRPVIVIELHDPDKIARMGTTNAETVRPLFDLGYRGFWCGNFRDNDATYEEVTEMTDRHEKLSLMVFSFDESLGYRLKKKNGRYYTISDGEE